MNNTEGLLRFMNYGTVEATFAYLMETQLDDKCLLLCVVITSLLHLSCLLHRKLTWVFWGPR